jgi:hypothetical protein
MSNQYISQEISIDVSALTRMATVSSATCICRQARGRSPHSW